MMYVGVFYQTVFSCSRWRQLVHVLWEWSTSSPKAETVSTQQEAITSQQPEAITLQPPESNPPNSDYRADALVAKTLFASDMMVVNKKGQEKEVS
jgi:hypothetical protein